MLKRLSCVLIFICTFAASRADAPLFPEVRLEPVFEGLNLPVYATYAPDGSGRLFIVSLDGLVHILKNGKLLTEPFLSLSGTVTAQEGEQGMYSLAFHPDYAANRRFFVSYTEAGTGDVVVSEHQASFTHPDLAEHEGQEIIRFTPLVPYHHGGQLAFGPDGYLYISFGDGTGPLFTRTPDFERAQSLTELAGKILRIDVDSPGQDASYSVPADNPFTFMDWVPGEVYALGLRNPWKFSFDRETGELYAGDVGNYDWEEVNIIEAGGNYGWPVREGPVCFIFPDTERPASEDCENTVRYLEPLHSYGHVAFDEAGGNAIVGGYVYRGKAYPKLDGLYLYADFTNGRIWGLRTLRTTALSKQLLDTDLAITSFVEDEAGELYVLDIAGGLHRIVPAD